MVLQMTLEAPLVSQQFEAHRAHHLPSPTPWLPRRHQHKRTWDTQLLLSPRPRSTTEVRVKSFFPAYRYILGLTVRGELPRPAGLQGDKTSSLSGVLSACCGATPGHPRSPLTPLSPETRACVTTTGGRRRSVLPPRRWLHGGGGGDGWCLRRCFTRLLRSENLKGQ